MKQPALGIVATVGTIAVSLLLIKILGPDLFMGWYSYVLMCALPFVIVWDPSGRDRNPNLSPPSPSLSVVWPFW